MIITKLGHCCLLIEEEGLRILTDPGHYTVAEQEKIKDLDIVVITHEHADHLHVESLQKVMDKNPQAQIVTNSAVAKILAQKNLDCQIVEDRQEYKKQGLVFAGYGNKHAEIYKDFSRVQNTGYFIGRRFFYPGDAFVDPQRQVDILALPVAGPWVKISQSVNYALKLKPKICLPVHDGMLKAPGGSYKVPEIFLVKDNIKFTPLTLGQIYNL